MSNHTEHLYNVHLATGLVRMVGSDLVREFGPDVFDRDEVEHSEWCATCAHVYSEPPF